MRILVSNDDGADAPGLRALAEALLELGEVAVCAPDREQSATSRSISLHRPLRIEKLSPWGPAGEIERWSVDGGVIKTRLRTTATYSTGQTQAMKLDPVAINLGVVFKF